MISEVQSSVDAMCIEWMAEKNYSYCKLTSMELILTPNGKAKVFQKLNIIFPLFDSHALTQTSQLGALSGGCTQSKGLLTNIMQYITRSINEEAVVIILCKY